jgi:hypothetical protein
MKALRLASGLLAATVVLLVVLYITVQAQKRQAVERADVASEELVQRQVNENLQQAAAAEKRSRTESGAARERLEQEAKQFRDNAARLKSGSLSEAVSSAAVTRIRELETALDRSNSRYQTLQEQYSKLEQTNQELAKSKSDAVLKELHAYFDRRFLALDNTFSTLVTIRAEDARGTQEIGGWIEFGVIIALVWAVRSAFAGRHRKRREARKVFD